MSEKNQTILICQGTGCASSNSAEIQKALEDDIAEAGLDNKLDVKLTGCHGFCQQGPLVIIEPEGTFYRNVKIKDSKEIVESHLQNNKPVERLFYKDPKTGAPVQRHQDIEFYKKQQQRVLRNCGHVNPEEIKDYTELGGYEALKKVLFEMTPEQVIEELKTSGLRGRGGGGFPAGRKWEAGLQAKEKEKYIVCNADEGDPGAFMDRSMLEADPHSVLEGMIIAGHTIGAQKGYIYVRAEYPLAVKRLKVAIQQATDMGFLGDNIMDSGFGFEILLFQGAGAFVCGESTALTLSMEGKRGMPKAAPRPRTTEEGLFDKPTLLNNVKTFAYVPQLINRGGSWFASIGTEKSKGTAVFALTGMVENCGLIEVPMGITLREIIFDIGGGIPGNKKFKAVQTGGPSGGCLPESFLDTPVDYDSLISAGSMMGSGGMVVMDESTCMVDIARYFLDFTQKESCGQCTLCKLGTKQMLNLLEEITQGKGRPGDIDLLLEIGEAVNAGSLCGLGQSAANPVLTTIKYFREEYEAHINEKHCPALACKALISYRIDAEKCKGCTMCAKNCPVEAITGEKKEVHMIDQVKCIRCGVCMEKCPKKFRAVECVQGRLNEGGK
ncbi:MAG: 4Fe-4S binding protein [Deltaproteobacteria bacterium]|jgi:NADH:ubiquinone oxidoreductase subunit F (NADH-binding)/(2Fe-2S) ferredoxin/NAD-dependent dihydropyrimidine dehydrogenase PreA subunit|nr:4Fe-4S binding protein [Deltaproteobacteria bacterium]